jgi:caffeoyl-CoA O-methyltransferase
MNWIEPKAETYAGEITSPSDDLLKEVEAYTKQHHAHAHMISGALQGKLLQLLSQMIRPNFILELGTFTGYSSICLAEGLTTDGQLHTIELREEDAQIAFSFFQKSSRADQILLHQGNALNILSTLNFEWDLVFLDADKVNYIAYYEAIVPQMKSGAWMIADNVLFHGQVLEEKLSGKNAIAIDQFNRHVKADSRTEQVFLTVRDGLLLIRKK